MRPARSSWRPVGLPTRPARFFSRRDAGQKTGMGAGEPDGCPANARQVLADAAALGLPRLDGCSTEALTALMLRALDLAELLYRVRQDGGGDATQAEYVAPADTAITLHINRARECVIEQAYPDFHTAHSASSSDEEA